MLIRDGEETRLGAKVTVALEAGDVVSYRTCGGGGYGPPEERDPARVLRDVLEEKVSVERARDVYRVAVVGPRARRGGDGGAAAREPSTRRRSHLLRGDPQRARRGDGRDGAGAEAQRLLDEHQDALRLLVRLLRRRAALGRAGVHAAGAPGLDGAAGAVRDRALRRRRTSGRATRSSRTTRTRAACT